METVTVELPKDLLEAARVPAQYAAREVQKMLVLYLYARGTVSLGRACELLDVSQWEFFELNKEWGLPLHYGVEEYREDLAALQETAG